MPRSGNHVAPARIMRVLRDVFKLTTLREGQESVIVRVLRGLSTLAVMPTGAGKSLCYQLPAVLLGGRTVVISPLIALMKDQCDALLELGIAAVQMHSNLSAGEFHAAQDAIADGSARIVFTTPEQLMRADFVAVLTRRPVALLVLDEAHCLSQWGFDFRPAFLEIGNIVQSLGRPTIVALTATATQSVLDDITSLLDIPRAGVIGTNPLRPNLHYRTEHFSRAEDKLARLIELVGQSQGSGLVYAATVKSAEALYEALVATGDSVGLYHGKLSAAKRHAAQDAFMNGRLRVMVATNAFGLGIDKPDIRFVIHHQVPSGLDAYCQESGRAGRDGEVAVCTLLFVDGDRGVQQFFLAGRYPRLNEFLALHETLSRAAPDRPAWELDALVDQVGNRRKVIVAVNLLRQQGLVSASADGQLRLTDAAGTNAAALEQLAQACQAKAQRDQAMLERMIAYAQSGQCRWRLLLEHLEGAPTMERCMTCDNCLRLSAHQAAQLAPSETPAGSSGGTAAQRPPSFAIGQRVRTRRHGQAEVVATDGLSVTVQFENGETRCFMPQFLAPARPPIAPRRPASTPQPLSLLDPPAPAPALHPA